MPDSRLKSLAEYSRFIAELLTHPQIERSTVAVWSDSPYTGIAEGEVFFTHGIRLRMREEIDFAAALIASYGYEVYRGNERLYWYDDFPHPHDPALASTFPHHKHVPPDIRRHRIPAPGLSFEQPNLPAILQEIEDLPPA
ncbi:MAG: hypothetical protein QOF89_79 [Acidobacteriota bacterium]|jgi:hypothetical protein|nr:hypothetical protein [Acidobacteriota bacterium]